MEFLSKPGYLMEGQEQYAGPEQAPRCIYTNSPTVTCKEMEDKRRWQNVVHDPATSDKAVEGFDYELDEKLRAVLRSPHPDYSKPPLKRCAGLFWFYQLSGNTGQDTAAQKALPLTHASRKGGTAKSLPNISEGETSISLYQHDPELCKRERTCH